MPAPPVRVRDHGGEAGTNTNESRPRTRLAGGSHEQSADSLRDALNDRAGLQVDLVMELRSGTFELVDHVHGRRGSAVEVDAYRCLERARDVVGIGRPQ